MKKIVMAAVFIALVAGAAFAQVSRGSTAWISARTVNLKASTGFFARSNGSLAYGDQVTVVQVSGKWAEVRSSSNSRLTGWVSTASLSTRRIIPGSTSSATASEVAHAGKGFNQEVENVYRAEGGSLNYADVDRTEAIEVSDDELYNFLTEGHLATGAQ